MDVIEIGNNIKKERKNKKLTQQELANKIGRTESSIRKYEKGLVQIPLDVLEQIATVLEVSAFDIMGADYWDEKYNSDGKLTKEVLLSEQVERVFGKGAAELLDAFSKLNEKGKPKVVNYATDLCEIDIYLNKQK